MACKEGQFVVVELMVNDQFKIFSINLNAQHVNGITPFDLDLSTVITYSRVGWVKYRDFLESRVATLISKFLLCEVGFDRWENRVMRCFSVEYKV